MTTKLERVSIKNFRSLARVDSLELGNLTLLFGPNGSGKSTFLDSIWFVRDCAIQGVADASSRRSHGIGVLYDGADTNDENIEIELATADVSYSLKFDLTNGRINPWPGETLRAGNTVLIERSAGTDSATMYHSSIDQVVPVAQLREPDKLTLSPYLNFNPNDENAGALDQLMHFVRFYHSRSFFLHQLKSRGSESSYHTHLYDRGQNLWSALRNIKEQAEIDKRYKTVMHFMAKAFPSFQGIVFEQTGSSSVYASFREHGRREPINASGVSDGHLQMLLLLTALFSEGNNRSSLLLFDEPEISLHPWAISVLAEAMKVASEDWNNQVLVATHSPVLISQFAPSSILAAVVDEGATELRRVSEIAEVQDLLDDYATGSLYMSEMIAGQSAHKGNIVD
ncbi:MAG: AAA family ATPase [Pirellulaceae bacterium]|jgi:predicted ATPase|nr:AAA family ATPase [Pirellulaceae bacterium]